MLSKGFIRTKENFTCERCGHSVVGTGYTNHCPKCLWSKHVDVNPGDRKATCGGLMEPTRIEVEKGVYVLTHICVACGHTKRNKVSQQDDMDTLIALAHKYATNKE